MTPAIEALARRAVACKRWRWIGGILFVWRDKKEPGGWAGPERVRFASVSEAGIFEADDMPGSIASETLPELTDPATIGCLLALVREAYGNRSLSTMYGWGIDDVPGWAFTGQPACGAIPMWGRGDTEGETLVVALENAP